MELFMSHGTMKTQLVILAVDNGLTGAISTLCEQAAANGIMSSH